MPTLPQDIIQAWQIAGRRFYDWVSVQIFLSIAYIRSSETEITDGCELPCGCWELTPSTLEEQQVLLTSEPSLLPKIFPIFLFQCNPKNHCSIFRFCSWQVQIALIPLISLIMCYLPFCVLFISLNMPFKFTNIISNDGFHYFYSWIIYIVYIAHLFIHSTIGAHLMEFRILDLTSQC